MSRVLARQGAVFALVGAAATATHVGFGLAARRLEADPMAANLTGYAAAVGVSYLGNARLTFRTRALHGPQFVRFVTVSLLGLAVNLGLTWLISRRLGLGYGWSLAAVVLAVPALSFGLSKFWAFRS